MLSLLNRRGTGTGGGERSGRSVRINRPTSNQPLVYTLNGITVSFPLPIPSTNAIHNVVVVYSCMSRPAHGSDAERKWLKLLAKPNTRSSKKMNPA